jgi:Ca-activated chloride channel family protein
MTDWAFHDPWWFAALLLLPVAALLRRRRRQPVFVVPFAAEWHPPGGGASPPWPAACAYLGMACLVVALARPQETKEKNETHQHGYDIVLAVDLSGSMLAEDYTRAGSSIDRLQAVKPVLEAFIDRRPGDRIGVVLFGGRAYTLAPLTFDHAWLRRQVARLRVGLIEEEKTAIGDGLGVALARLEQGRKESAVERKGAFVVLLTDGANNAGALDPMEAAVLAAERKVTVYTIGAGKEGWVRMPQFDAEGRKIGYRPQRSELDETLLRRIAEQTRGEYFRAAESRTVEAAFAAIDRAEKIEFEARSTVVTAELFAPWATAGLAALAAAAAGAIARPRREAAA